MNPKLQQAIEIFESLGWHAATPENIGSLTTGTPEQKRTALEGLKSGVWPSLTQVNASGATVAAPHQEASLALFAIRVGVSAARAVSVLQWLRVDADMLAHVVKTRSAKFAASFVELACKNEWGVRATLMSRHADLSLEAAILRIVFDMGLDIPQSAGYIHTWFVVAHRVMYVENYPQSTHRSESTQLHAQFANIMKRRFEEHVAMGVALNAPPGRFLGADDLVEAMRAGWIDRTRLLDLAFTALDASVRPADRMDWICTLDKLGLDNAEILARAQSIIPMLGLGDRAIVARFAPTLVAEADEGLLAEVLLAALSVQTKKARTMLLTHAIKRPRPDDAETIAPWLLLLSDDKDKKIATLANRLAEKWDIALEPAREDSGEAVDLWQPTPDVWACPRFEVGEVSPEGLTDMAAELLARPPGVSDVRTEQFLAQMVALAHTDTKAVRTSLYGLTKSAAALNSTLFFGLHGWIKGMDYSGSSFYHKVGTRAPISARDYAAIINLGRLPFLLSTPSRVDLTITVPDLARRLQSYKDMGLAAEEPDLYLALTRLDVKTATPEAKEQLARLDVNVALLRGAVMDTKAGDAVLKCIAQPIQEPELHTLSRGIWSRRSIDWDKSMSLRFSGFPKRRPMDADQYSVYPNFGDWAFCMLIESHHFNNNTGLIMRQAARRSTPLPPGTAINFIAALRKPSPRAAEDAWAALSKAWERGLLRPGVPDLKYLDWLADTIKGLAALATAMEAVAQAGMLSVVWPLLDELVGKCLEAPRPPAGLVDIVRLIEVFLPEAELAISKGLADAGALALPSIRTLAGRSGKSQAVLAAKEIVVRLPRVGRP